MSGPDSAQRTRRTRRRVLRAQVLRGEGGGALPLALARHARGDDQRAAAEVRWREVLDLAFREINLQ
eukprot:220852-Rhodomonas_salina.1